MKTYIDCFNFLVNLFSKRSFHLNQKTMITKFLKTIGIIAFVAMACNVSAQVRIGVKAGFNSATVTNLESITLGNLSDIDDIPGFQVAGIFEFNLGGSFALQPELSFVRQNFDFNPQDLQDSTNVYGFKQLVTDYFQVPVLGKVGIGSGNLGFYLNAGPSLGYLLSATNVDSENDTEEELDLDSLEDVINRFDLGLNMGGGVSLKMGPGKLYLDFRYDMGLNEFINNVNNQELEALQGRDYSVSLMYLINI